MTTESENHDVENVETKSRIWGIWQNVKRESEQRGANPYLTLGCAVILIILLIVILIVLLAGYAELWWTFGQ